MEKLFPELNEEAQEYLCTCLKEDGWIQLFSLHHAVDLTFGKKDVAESEAVDCLEKLHEKTLEYLSSLLQEERMKFRWFEGEEEQLTEEDRKNAIGAKLRTKKLHEYPGGNETLEEIISQLRNAWDGQNDVLRMDVEQSALIALSEHKW